MLSNKFFNPYDNNKKYERLYRYCQKTLQKQNEAEKLFRNHKNELLIRDKNGNLKKVNKYYKLYRMENDEYETETELEDEEFEMEKQAIIKKYSY